MSTDFIKKVCLGTAQFGLPYGVANKRGQVPKSEVFEILRQAYAQGIVTLDTAFNYGESEAIIGEFSQRYAVVFNVISKSPRISGGDEMTIKRAILQSLQRLNSEHMYGYLVHAFDDFLRYEKLWPLLVEYKEQHLLGQIGFSLYTIDELKALFEKNIAFDMVQLPYNIFDQRFAPYFARLKERGAKIYIRSVFLQGLFFLDAKMLPEKFASIRPQLEQLHRISQRTRMGIHELCLGFVMRNPEIDNVVIGIDSIAQLRKNLEALSTLDKIDVRAMKELRALSVDNESILLPYNWK